MKAKTTSLKEGWGRRWMMKASDYRKPIFSFFPLDKFRPHVVLYILLHIKFIICYEKNVILKQSVKARARFSFDSIDFSRVIVEKLRSST